MITYAIPLRAIRLAVFSILSLSLSAGLARPVLAQPNLSPNAGIESRWRPPANSWRLGVSIRNTNAGVSLTQVQPGSPAAAAGLEAGDTILTVQGQQVGYVNGQLFDLGDVIWQYLQPGAAVTMLIQDHRTLRLRNVSVSPAGTNGILTGTAVYQVRSPGITRQAVLTVRLRDRTFSNWAGAVLDEITVQRADREQIPFQLKFDQSQIFPGHQYVVEAEVRDRNQVKFQGSAPWDTVPGVITLRPVATSFSGSVLGALAPSDQINQWYQQHLGRPATRQEQVAWENHLARGQSLDQIRAYLLASNEYLDQHQQDPDRYVGSVFQALRGKVPTPAEQQRWRQQFDQSNGVRSQFLQRLMSDNTAQP